MNSVEIPLSKGKIALVDEDCFENLSRFEWYANKPRNTWYAVRDQRLSNGLRFQLKMHSFIIGCPMPGFEIDHINGNGLDNRRSNLRIVSRRENQENRYYHRDGSHLVGTSFSRVRKLWESRIYFNGKNIRVGFFNTAREAFEAREKKKKSLIFNSFNQENVNVPKG